MVEIIFIFLGVICTVLGLIGCVIPIIPGIPLNYMALLLLQYAKEEPVFSKSFLIKFAFYSIIVFLLEYMLPIFGAKLYGTTKRGIWGAVIGMIIGIFIIPPVGMILGLLLGAIIGELSAGKKSSLALKAGFATFLGSMMATFIKLSLSLLMTFYFFSSLFKI